MSFSRYKKPYRRCVLCGDLVPPYLEGDALPLARGAACSRCFSDRVMPTRMNNGVPSHRETRKNLRDRYVSVVVVDDLKGKSKEMKQICEMCVYCQYPRSYYDNGGSCKCKAMKRKTIDVYVGGGEVPDWCPINLREEEK